MGNLDLQETRGQLDEIDTRLVELFEKWMEPCGQVAEFKVGMGKAVYDGQREKQKPVVVAAMAHSEFNRKGVHELSSWIITISRRLQYRPLAKHGKGGDTGLAMMDELKREGMRIVYQGVEGAYSHRAALQYFGEDANVYHIPVFEDIMTGVEEGRTDYGAPPIGNSLVGAAIDNYDNLLKHDIYTMAETKVAVDHAFLGLLEASLGGIRCVYPHPQGLMQCSGYLGAHRQWSQISVENIAGVAKKVLEEGEVSQAAVANPTAGILHGPKIPEASINSNKNNTTRFIIVARKPMYRKGVGEVSICFEGLHKSGSLYNMLENFIYNDVNTLMIESRPIRERSWEYRFFVDVEGLLGDPAARNALLGISEEAVSMRILGNYQGGRKVIDIKDLVIYRSPKHQELSRDIAHLMGYAQGGQELDGVSCGGQLTELVVKYGFEGNLWYCSLAFCPVNNGNAYTTTCEITGPAGGFLDELAREDCRILKALFDYDIRNLEPSRLWALMEDYKPAEKDSRVSNHRIRNRIVNLAVQLEESADAGESQDHVVNFYRELGVGKFGLSKAFRIIEREEDQPVIIDPVINMEHIYFKDTVGYELRKQKLIENTEAFMEGKEASNVLLSGDAGTGRSSSVEVVLNEYYGRGLRITEVYKHQFRALSDMLGQTRDRNHKFIIYMDDLSFEDYELEYRYLKAILEGGLGKHSGNVFIYAISNRRHLVREKFSDKRELDNELYNDDTMQEKPSLAAQFGVTIYYGSPDKRQFETIVKALADCRGLDMPEQEPFAEASKWELSHGGLSGRTVAQFITRLGAKQQVLCGTSFT